jgi:hypothetical protein
MEAAKSFKELLAAFLICNEYVPVIYKLKKG